MPLGLPHSPDGVGHYIAYVSGRGIPGGKPNAISKIERRLRRTLVGARLAWHPPHRGATIILRMRSPASPAPTPIRRCKTKRCHPEDDRRHGGDGELRYAVRTPQRGDVAVRTRRGDWAAPRLSSSMSVATKPSTAVAGARFSARAFPSRCAARTPGVRSNSLRRRRRRSLDGSHRDLAEAGAHRLRPIVSAGDRSGPGGGTRSAEGTRVHRAST